MIGNDDPRHAEERGGSGNCTKIVGVSDTVEQEQQSTVDGPFRNLSRIKNRQRSWQSDRNDAAMHDRPRDTPELVRLD